MRLTVNSKSLSRFYIVKIPWISIIILLISFIAIIVHYIGISSIKSIINGSNVILKIIGDIILLYVVI